MTDNEAMQLIENWPAQMCKPVDEQKKLAKDIVKHLSRSIVVSGFNIARMYPAIGAVEAFIHLGLLSGDLNVGNMLMNKAKKGLGDIPGRNDFLMVKWFILRDPELAKEMLARTKHPDPAISATCAWMLASVSERHPDLAQQMAAVGTN